MTTFGKHIGKHNVENVKKHFPEMDGDLAYSYISIVKNCSWVTNNIENFLALNDLSFGRMAILMELFSQKEEGPISPAELARHHGCKKATVTGLLDKLERDGLVERSNNTEDRRKIDVTITTVGIDMLQEFLPTQYELLSKALAGTTEEERNLTLNLLSKMNERIEKHNEDLQKGKSDES
jgi:DNA-binding MarR family transcriptional regulator